MIGTFKRSWELTKVCFSVMNKDREMLFFPMLAGIFSIIFAVAMVFPTIIMGFINGGNQASLEILDYVLIFITYFGLAYIATFFNVCVVYTTKTRFQGYNATFGESIRFALSKWSLIAKWSLLAASVGLLLRIIEKAAENLGSVGEMVVNLITSLAGLAWSVITVFVVPTLVYHELEPVAAVKYSANVLKKTWGETLIKAFGLGLIQFIFIILGAGILFFLLPTLFGALGMGTTGMILSFVLMGIYVILVVLVFNVANDVYNTALFEYAENGRIPEGFNQEVLDNAFKPRRKRGL